MNIYPAKAFARHLLTARSTAGYGVHSPFVFDFLTRVLRGGGDASITERVEVLRREMLSDRRTVKVTDLGAGSSVHRGTERRIPAIASSAALPARQTALLSRIAADLREATRHDDSESGTGGKGIILELGTSLGITTLALALAAPERRVLTVEGCPALAAIARANLLRHGAANAEVLNMEFSEALEMLKREGKEVTMAFIDGNHRGEALKSYAEFIKTMGEEMIIVADDIHMNRDMYNAWRSLDAPATLETFRLGILFCLRSLTPGRYRVRY